MRFSIQYNPVLAYIIGVLRSFCECCITRIAQKWPNSALWHQTLWQRKFTLGHQLAAGEGLTWEIGASVKVVKSTFSASGKRLTLPLAVHAQLHLHTQQLEATAYICI